MLIERLDRIEDNLDAVRKHQTDHPSCPSPGLCGQLANSQVATSARVEKLEGRILTIERWQSWLTGMAAIVVLLLTLFGPTIRKVLKLE